MEIKPVAHIHTDFPEKFGIPRQSNLVKEARGTIVFEPEFSQPECVRGIEGERQNHRVVSAGLEASRYVSGSFRLFSA